MRHLRPCGGPRVTELVWDIDACGTCTGSEGITIRAGEDGDWQPEQLLALAFESELMSGFMRLARQRGLEVLGYVSAAQYRQGEAGTPRPRLCIHPCVVVGSRSDAERARGLMAEAYARCELAGLLRDRPRLELEVTTIDEQAVTVADA